MQSGSLDSSQKPQTQIYFIFFIYFIFRKILLVRSENSSNFKTNPSERQCMLWSNSCSAWFALQSRRIRESANRVQVAAHAFLLPALLKDGKKKPSDCMCECSRAILTVSVRAGSCFSERLLLRLISAAAA